MYKMIVLDLDGTLLTSDKKISLYSLEVLKRIKSNTRIVLASARGFFSIKKYLEELELLNKDDYTIAFNGCLLLNNIGTPVINNYIKKVSLLEQYMTEKKSIDWYYYTFDKMIPRKELKNISDFINSEKIYKIVGISEEQEIRNMRKALPKQILQFFQITSSELNRIEFVEKGMTKIGAIEKLLSIFNIKKEEVIAIGDGENDIDMLSFVGCGIAMGNAIDAVKDVANIITDINDNDGVGKILNSLFE